MENYIMLDGKKFEMNDSLIELLRGIIKEKEKVSPFAREERQAYYYISEFGSTTFSAENKMRIDDTRYNVGNYCTDEKLMEQRALHETLNRLLWRYREEWDGDFPWDGEHQHWYILERKGELTVDFTMTHHIQGVIYFSLCDNAVDAIEQVVKPFMAKHPDFVW